MGKRIAELPDGGVVQPGDLLPIQRGPANFRLDANGFVGPQGPQGPQGTTGNAGLQGPAGNDGAQGPQGIQGETGLQGPQGIQGIQGPPGTNGTNGTNGQGVPVGGSTGQVLAKTSAADFATSWQTPIVYNNTGVAATPATTGTMSVSMTTRVVTITPTGACTFNATGGTTGHEVTFAITTSGTSSFVLTFGTNFRKAGTLATGTVSARFFSVTFVCVNGTIWQEIARTAVLS